MLIVAYQSDWSKYFEAIKSKLIAGLSGICIQIEHVGSTAVLGLSAKEIIDIDIAYNDNFEEIKEKLELIGYYHNGNQGIDGREVFKRNQTHSDSILDVIPHHLYVCRYDNEEYKRHILFRNYLRKSEEARMFYMSQKIAIAEECNNNKKAYAELKQIKLSSFIDYTIELSKKDNYEFKRVECLDNN